MTGSELTAAVNVAALLFVGAQVILARQAIKESSRAQQQEWSRLKREATIEASISAGQYRERLKADLPWNDRDPAEVAAFLKDINGDHSRAAPIREYLNHLTELAVGVQQGVFDLETLSMIQGGRIIDIVASYGEYIESLRVELDRPSIYEDLEELAEALKDHRKGKL